MIDLDALDRLLTGHGHGPVTLPPQLVTELVAEVRELRRQLLLMTLVPTEAPSLTTDDLVHLQAIADAMQAGQLANAVQLLHHYYHSADRADRTPRGTIYLHLGMVFGLFDLQGGGTPS